MGYVGRGSSTQILTDNAGGTLPNFQTGTSGAFTSVVVQTFTANGTYTPTSGMKYCIVEALAGGGGGGGCAAGGANFAASPGGAAGSYGKGVYSAATIGASKTVTIGAAGSGGAAGNNSGTAGGNTSFGALLTTNGGSAGGGTMSYNIYKIFAATGGGAAGTGGFLNLAGTNAIGSIITPPSPDSPAVSGPGADSFYGIGGSLRIAGTGTDVAGLAGTGYGSGGSGGSSFQGGSGAAGGDGTAGIVIVTEYIS